MATPTSTSGSTSSSSKSQYPPGWENLADRRRSTVSKYLESDNHKSEFAHKLKDMRERERTVSGSNSKASSQSRVDSASPDLDDLDVAPIAPSADTTVLRPSNVSSGSAPAPAKQPFVGSSGRSVPEPRRSSSQSSDHHRMSAYDALSGRRPTGRQSIGGLMVINESMTPNINDSPRDSDGSPGLHSSPGTSNFPGFNASPFKNVFGQRDSRPGNLSPGTQHGSLGTADSPMSSSIKTLLAAPRAKQEMELHAKFSYLSALVDENNQLRDLLQRQADLSPTVDRHARGGHGSRDDEEDNGKDEIIQSLSLQLADQMDSHDKVIYELGLLRSNHATLQALSSDYFDELEMLRHQVRDLQDQVVTGQAETEEMRKNREQEEEARRHESKRVEMLRQALEDSKTAIKRLQDQSNQRRQSLVDSRRTSISSSADRRPLQSLNPALHGRIDDSYTQPHLKRGSISADRRGSLLLNQADYAAKARRRASLALAMHDADVPKPRPRSTIAHVGLGFDMPDEAADQDRPRRNSSGGVQVHLEAMSPRPGDNSPSMTAEDRDKRKKEIEGDIERLRSPSDQTMRNATRSTAAEPPALMSSLGLNQVMIDMHELAKLKAESLELEEMKSEMALLKVKFAECEEAKAAALDALNTLRQSIASDPSKSHGVANMPLGVVPDSKKVGRWGMPKMPGLVSRTSSGQPLNGGTQAPPLTTPKSSNPESAITTPGPVTPASSIFSWNRRNDSIASSATSISPSTSPVVEVPTPSLASSSTFGKFSLTSLVGMGSQSSQQPTTSPGHTTAAASPRQRSVSQASPPSLAHSVSSAETSPLGSPKTGAQGDGMTPSKGSADAISPKASSKAAWSPPLARLDMGSSEQAKTPKVGG